MFLKIAPGHAYIGPLQTAAVPDTYSHFRERSSTHCVEIRRWWRRITNDRNEFIYLFCWKSSFDYSLTRWTMWVVLSVFSLLSRTLVARWHDGLVRSCVVSRSTHSKWFAHTLPFSSFLLPPFSKSKSKVFEATFASGETIKTLFRIAYAHRMLHMIYRAHLRCWHSNWIQMPPSFICEIGELNHFNWNLLKLFTMEFAWNETSRTSQLQIYVKLFIITHPLCLQWFPWNLNFELIIIMKRA